MKLLRFKFNLSSMLIAISGLTAVIFIVLALVNLWGYYRLQESTVTTVTQWEAIQKSSSAFALEAAYTFDVQGKTYKGKTIFSKPYHLNAFSAQKQIQDNSKKSWRVWYCASQPELSSLEKIFPLKKCLYALMTLGIFLYFRLSMSL